MTTLSDLIARVEAGEVSAELEAEVCAALDHRISRIMPRGHVVFTPAPVLTSLDAAYALKEAVLPGWGDSHDALPHCLRYEVWPRSDDDEHVGVAPTHAAALVAAILRAWERKG